MRVRTARGMDSDDIADQMARLKSTFRIERLALESRRRKESNWSGSTHQDIKCIPPSAVHANSGLINAETTCLHSLMSLKKDLLGIFLDVSIVVQISVQIWRRRRRRTESSPMVEATSTSNYSVLQLISRPVPEHQSAFLRNQFAGHLPILH